MSMLYKTQIDTISSPRTTMTSHALTSANNEISTADLHPDSELSRSCAQSTATQRGPLKFHALDTMRNEDV